MATCPECDAEIEVDDDDLDEMEAGDPWDCDACGTRLRVTILDPLDFEADDDDDDDDDDEDDDDEEKEKEDDAETDDDVDDVDDTEETEDWDE